MAADQRAETELDALEAIVSRWRIRAGLEPLAPWRDPEWEQFLADHPELTEEVEHDA
jgi:hypothetical protein